jgi:hypothetical protein
MAFSTKAITTKWKAYTLAARFYLERSPQTAHTRRDFKWFLRNQSPPGFLGNITDIYWIFDEQTRAAKVCKLGVFDQMYTVCADVSLK